MTIKLLLLCLLASLAIQSAARACQYCALAANDPEMAKLAAEMHAKAGGFPLDSTINKFQPAIPPAALTTPPPAASVATRVADLPPTPTRRPLAPPPRDATVPTQNTASRWANGGLLGLLGLAGFFGWRTRRTTGASEL